MRDSKRLDMLRVASLIALAAGIVLMTTFSPILQDMLSTRIQGASPGLKYLTLGIRHAQGVRYHFNSTAIEKLSGIVSPPLRIASALISTPENVSADRVHVGAQVEFYAGDYFKALHLAVHWAHVNGTVPGHSGINGIIVTAGLAKRLFGTDQHVLGKSVILHNPSGPYEINAFVIGVLPKASRFHGLLGGPGASAWMNFHSYARLRGFKFRLPKTTGGTTFKSNFQFSGVQALITAPGTMSTPRLRVALNNLWQAAFAQGAVESGSGFVVYPGYSLDPVATTATRLHIESTMVVACAVLIVALLNFLFSVVIQNVKLKPCYDVFHVLGHTSKMLFRDRLLAASKTSVALLVICAGLMPLSFALEKRIILFATYISTGHQTWVKSLTYVMALISAVGVLQLIVDVVSIHMLRAGHFTWNRSARSAYQFVGAIEFALAVLLVVVAAGSVQALADRCRTDIGIFGHRASIISIEPSSLSGLAVPDSIMGIDNAVSANNLALDAVHDVILETEPSVTAGFGPIPSVARDFSVERSTLVADGRRSSVCVHSIGPGWIEAADAHLIAGESLKRVSSPDASMVISSRSALALFGLVSRSIGQSVVLHMGHIHKHFTVVGVISPFVVNASMIPCAVALTNIYGRVGDFSDNGGHFVVRPVVPDAVVPILKNRINAALLRAATKLRVKTVETSAHLWRQLLAPYIFQSVMYLVIALTGALIAIGGALAQLLYAVAAGRRTSAIYSALGLKPTRIYRGLLIEFLLPVVIAILVAIVVLASAVARFRYIIGKQIVVLSASSIAAVAILLLAAIVVLHFPARRAARAEPAQSLHEL